MDTPYPFATKEELWRVQEEMRDIYAAQADHSDRIMRLERRRDDDTRAKNVWGPQSPFSGILGGPPHQADSALNPAAEAFRNFDHEPPQSYMNNLTLETDDEPKRGASRANSVRFDESAIHYAHSSRSSDMLPMRTGSGLSNHPLTERSLSHRSDGRQSSSTRTNSLGLDGSRLLGSVLSPMTPGMPPGLLILGPVPCIIRCWLTQTFSNDSLLYAAICSGSYKSSLDSSLVSRLGFDHLVQKDSDDLPRLKLPMYLPEATVSQASSRSSSPAPGLPALTVNFIVRNLSCNDKAIQIVVGSDILRSHSADILFSQDRLSIFDDERNRLTIPLVRPEDDLTFKSLLTTSLSVEAAADTLKLQKGDESKAKVEDVPEPAVPGVIGPPSRPPGLETQLTVSAPSTSGASSASPAPYAESFDDTGSEYTTAKGPELDHPSERTDLTMSRSDVGGIWGNWRHGSTTKTDTSSQAGTISSYRTSRTRGMKVLKPNKPSSGAISARSFSAAQPASSAESTPVTRRASEVASLNNQEIQQPTPTKYGPSSNKPRSVNPVGEASAFGWLSGSEQKRAATTAK